MCYWISDCHISQGEFIKLTNYETMFLFFQKCSGYESSVFFFIYIYIYIVVTNNTINIHKNTLPDTAYNFLFNIKNFSFIGYVPEFTASAKNN